MRFQGIFVPIIIVILVLVFILPIPEGILDLLHGVNIMISAIILLNTIYIKDAEEISIFPTLLVITTIFRLSVNVATTKLILADGSAGKVVDGFGNFVARGNMVVGFVVFIIIVIVNFLVITKGAERIAEVAARFTLDAMPGKQMAIDADLNSGMIDENEARERRKKVQKSADFYGAMDGATKFVKNDAIAGILIGLINIVGGLITGMLMRGESFQEALQTYALLTIGDGLVCQIPALMISTATSFVVTRSASDTEISQELLGQLFRNHIVMYIAAFVSFVLSFFLAKIPFWLLTALFTYIGYSLSKQQKQEAVTEEEEQEIQAEEIRKPENVMSLLQIDPIELEFGYAIIPLADGNQGGDLLDRVVMIRRQLALELGMIVPIIRLRDNIQLGSNEYVIKIKGVEVARGELMPDHYLAINPGTVEKGIDGIKTTEPTFGLPALWITQNQTDRAEVAGYTVVDPPSVITTHLTEVIKQNAHMLLGRQDVQALIENVKQNYPVVVDELVPKLMTIGEIQKVLANLLKEGVSIRDMVTILETLGDYAALTRDAEVLTEYVRQALGRSITRKYFEGNKSTVITLDPELEQALLNAVQKTENGSYVALEPNIANKVINNLSKQIQKFAEFGQQPVVLASPMVRLYFKKLTEHVIPGLVVLSYNELDPGMEIQTVGMVSI
jgi:flagellar biosynthesis protein FlhA